MVPAWVVVKLLAHTPANFPFASVYLQLSCASLRNDKYSSKVQRYFVEYADKEFDKKTRTELQRHESTEEVGNPGNSNYNQLSLI